MPTIEHIELDLPNGFHDAKLFKLAVDYERGEVVMWIRADVSDAVLGSREPEYRPGELIIAGLAFFAMDVPRSTREAKALWIGAGPGQPSTSPIALPPLPDDCFLHWFFVNDWNGFIRVAAKNAEWRGGWRISVK